MKIGFIGIGKLGKEAAEVIAEKHDVVGFDLSTIIPSNFKMVQTQSPETKCSQLEL